MILWYKEDAFYIINDITPIYFSYNYNGKYKYSQFGGGITRTTNARCKTYTIDYIKRK